MIDIIKEGILLNKTGNGFENEGVLNPATIMVEDEIHLFYRAVSKGNHSSIGHCLLNAPMEVQDRSDFPIIFPQQEFESHGTEDPRITNIDGLYYLTYTAYDGKNALGALALSKDLVNWEKQGAIVPMITYNEFKHLAGSKGMLNEKYLRFNEIKNPGDDKNNVRYIWDKNVVFFPRRINGKLHFLHRVKPDIQLVAVTHLSELNIEFWQHYFLHFEEWILMTPEYPHEVSYIGSGCTPIETEHGWLLIYHGVHDTVKGYVYVACAALLDLDNPLIEIARLPYALFKPELQWEMEGEVNNVCFPTGAIVKDGRLYIYYGAADERIGCASVYLEDLLTELLKNQKPQTKKINS